jgi:transcriptional regulator with XRE-family HTH domain
MASTSPFGEHLKREREMRGVSLEEVSSATRISTKFLEAIESGQWDQLPGGAFNRGFIRSASRYLGLDDDSMVAEYSLETNSNGASHAAQDATSEMPRDWRLIVALLAVILVVAAALIAGGWFGVSKIKARLHTRSSAAGATATAPATSAASANPLTLSLIASNLADIRVIADGKLVFEGPIKGSETKQFGARDVLEISASDAGSVRLELNGQPVPAMGSAGQPGRVTLTARDVKSSAGGAH